MALRLTNHAMPANIETFVRNTLGCTCPEEVFLSIEQDVIADKADIRRWVIGQRLLIYLVDADQEVAVDSLVAGTVRRGLLERDARGLNRFRLVLLCREPAALEDQARALFAACKAVDERTHLHLVSYQQLDAVIHDTR